MVQRAGTQNIRIVCGILGAVGLDTWCVHAALSAFTVSPRDPTPHLPTTATQKHNTAKSRARERPNVTHLVENT